jgi:hypothetical protein
VVRQVGEQAESTELSSIGKAIRFVGGEYRQIWFPGFRDQLLPEDPEKTLAFDAPSATAIADWLGFSASVLEELRHRHRKREPSRPQLWPEHLDMAVELVLAGEHSSVGCSPGDDAHPEPYLYVTGNEAVDRTDARWNDEHFFGASLSYQQLLEAEDQREAALAFFADSLRDF